MKLGRTSALGVVSSLVSGVTLFIVFRIAIDVVGAPLLGAWVMIQSAFILSRLPEAGVGINITRMVSIESRAGDPNVRSFFAAGFLTSVIPVFLIGLVILEPTVWLLKVVFQSQLDPSTLRFLAGLSLATALFVSTAALALSIVEGLGRLDRRHYVTMAANVVMSTSAYPLVTSFGVAGIGMAYCAHAATMCAGGLLLLLLRTRGAKTPPARSSSNDPATALSSGLAVSKRLWRQNMVVSGMALMGMTYEPWTKFLVTSAGGLAAVAYVDLAMKIPLQFRVAIQAAAQPLLGHGARHANDFTEAEAGFDRAQRLVTKSNLFLISFQLAAAPFVSYLALGAVSAEFMLFYLMLAVGNAVCSMGVVGYYYDASGGHLARLFRINATMMVLNLVLGAAGALSFGAAGAVFGFAASFAYGGILHSASWRADSGRRWADELRAEAGTLAQAIVAVALAILFYGSLATRVESWIAAAASALLCTTLLALFLWRLWRAYV